VDADQTAHRAPPSWRSASAALIKGWWSERVLKRWGQLGLNRHAQLERPDPALNRLCAQTCRRCSIGSLLPPKKLAQCCQNRRHRRHGEDQRRQRFGLNCYGASCGEKLQQKEAATLPLWLHFNGSPCSLTTPGVPGGKHHLPIGLTASDRADSPSKPRFFAQTPSLVWWPTQQTPVGEAVFQKFPMFGLVGFYTREQDFSGIFLHG